MLKLKRGMNNENKSSFTNSNLSCKGPELKDLLNKYQLISYYLKFLKEKIGLKTIKILDFQSYQRLVSEFIFKLGEEIKRY